MMLLLPLLAMAMPADDDRKCRTERSGPLGSYSVERVIYARGEGLSRTVQDWRYRKGQVQVGVMWESRSLRLLPPPGDEMTFITLFDLPTGFGEVRMELRGGTVMAAAGGWSDGADRLGHAINLPLTWRELRRAVRAGALTVVVVKRDGRVVASAELDPAVIDAPGALADAARGEFAAKLADWRNRCAPYSQGY
jgi:hypothetical protein